MRALLLTLVHVRNCRRGNGQHLLDHFAHKTVANVLLEVFHQHLASKFFSALLASHPKCPLFRKVFPNTSASIYGRRGRDESSAYCLA